MRVADVFNQGQITIPGKSRAITDNDFEFDCDCGFSGQLADCALGEPDHVADISSYRCPSCNETVFTVGHWGMHEQPLRWRRYRISDYVVEARVGLLIAVNGVRVALPSQPDPA